jgi:polyprenyl-phospho-N-acetylgalactosaminyl synthase
MTKPSDLWIVVPAYNEGNRIANTLRPLIHHGYRNVVVVDDGSRDNTREAALSTGAWVARHVINCGQGAALQTGIDFALQRGAKFVVTFDADGQHSHEEIQHVVAPVVNGEADVTLGSRFLGTTIDMPTMRKWVLKAGIVFTRVVSRIRVTDVHNGFRAFSRDAAQRIRITQNRMAHASEILDQIRMAGLRFKEVPVTIRYSAETMAKGQSSWNAVRIAVQLLLGRFVR